MVLFFIIFAGYSFAGMMLFGKQFDGFSTVSHSFQSLLFVLLCLDPTQMWIQVRTSTKLHCIFETIQIFGCIQQPFLYSDASGVFLIVSGGAADAAFCSRVDFPPLYLVLDFSCFFCAGEKLSVVD